MDGFWLDAGEEQRILQLMESRKDVLRWKSEQETELQDMEQHDVDPGTRWGMELTRLRAKEFFQWLVDRLRFK